MKETSVVREPACLSTQPSETIQLSQRMMVNCVLIYLPTPQFSFSFLEQKQPKEIFKYQLYNFIQLFNIDYFQDIYVIF